MKELFDKPLFAPDKSLTLAGFFWAMVFIMAAFFAPLVLL